MKDNPEEIMKERFLMAIVGNIKKGCIEISFKVKNLWELENLKESVNCGLVLSRYLKQVLRASFESTLTSNDRGK